MKRLLCRLCSEPLRRTFIDLGRVPLSNAFRLPECQDEPEINFPLHARVCESCFLVQVEDFASPEKLFRDYPYFSSLSRSWLAHAVDFSKLAMDRLGLNAKSLVVEIASNDGYLLKNFQDSGIPVLGIEPARNVARAAESANIPVVTEFFTEALARELAEKKGQADLLVANNVLAHVPALNDFTAGIKLLLKPGGVASIEFPHLLQLMKENQFDTIYHEHFSYFSLWSAERLFEKHGLKVFDAERLNTNGGSLRLWVSHIEENQIASTALGQLRELEQSYGVNRIDSYLGFSDRIQEVKRALLSLVISIKNAGESIAAYGAPAKGTILLNYCGIREDFIDYAADLSPHKQGKFIPGTGILIVPPEKIFKTRPRYVLILPWNLRDEITAQMEGIKEWGGSFMVPLPVPRVIKPEPEIAV